MNNVQIFTIKSYKTGPITQNFMDTLKGKAP